MKKKNPSRTLEDSMKFNHPKMNIENLKAIFEESGNSMTYVSNKNDSERKKNKMVNGMGTSFWLGSREG